MSLRETLSKEAAKETKKDAGYSEGKPNAHCGICRHFEPPRACEIVMGRIDPKMWCKYFEKAASAKEKP